MTSESLTPSLTTDTTGDAKACCSSHATREAFKGMGETKDGVAIEEDGFDSRDRPWKATYEMSMFVEERP